MGAWQCAFVKSVPRLANASMCGVLACGCPPRQPTQSLRSSTAISKTLGLSPAKENDWHRANTNRTNDKVWLTFMTWLVPLNGDVSTNRKRVSRCRQDPLTVLQSTSERHLRTFGPRENSPTTSLLSHPFTPSGLRRWEHLWLTIRLQLPDMLDDFFDFLLRRACR